MPTTYPGTIDSLSNPSAGSYTPNPSHVGQHTDANDAIEAIETELGTTPSGAAATVAARITADEGALTTHAAAADPHTGYRLESADHSHASAGLQGGTVAHSVLTGLTSGDPHTQYQQESEKAAASGYASLDGSTKVPIAQVPTGTSGTTVSLGNHAHAPQMASALRTAGDYTTTSTSFVDVDATNLALTITTAARRVLIGVTAVGFHATSATDIYLDVMLDGARLGQTGGLVGNTCITGGSTIHNFSFTHLTAALTAASHTFKLQWRVSAATTGTLRASTGNQPLHFYVIEQGV